MVPLGGMRCGGLPTSKNVSASHDWARKEHKKAVELLASMHIDAWAGAVGGYSVPEYDRLRGCFCSSVCLAEQLEKLGELDGGVIKSPRL